MDAGRWTARREPWPGSFSLITAALAVVALIGLLRALLTLTYLNLHFTREVDPLTKAISHYVHVEQGAAKLTTALLIVAAASATILLTLAQLGVRLGGPAVVLFALWCTALVLCAAFPTDNSARIETAGGMVHQVAGVTLFAAFPLGGLALARNLAGQPDWARTGRLLRRLSAVAIALALGYLLARLPDLLPWFPPLLDGRAVSGLIQRVLFLLELGVLGLLGGRLLHTSWTAPLARRQEVFP